MNRKLLAATLTALALGGGTAEARPGAPDTSFHGGAFGPDNATASSLSVGPRGDFAVSGDTNALTATRFTARGFRVPAFAGGFATAPAGDAGTDRSRAALLLSSGKTLVAGAARVVAAGGTIERRAAVARFTTSGRLDVTWAGDGVLTTALGGRDSQITAMAPAPGGKLLVVGYGDPVTDSSDGEVDAGTPRLMIARLTATGLLDRSFGGGDGIATATPAGYDSIAFALLRLPNGSIVVGGSVARRPGLNHPDRFIIARFSSTGRLDRRFGRSGFAFADPSVASSIDGGYVLDLARAPNGRIVAGGIAGGSKDPDSVAIARFTASGRLDTGFGSRRGWIRDEGAFSDRPVAMVAQGNGKLVFAGTISGDLGVRRYTARGSRDRTFGSGGAARRDVNGGTDSAADVAIQPGGRILVAGTSPIRRGSSVTTTSVVRFLGGG